MYSSPISIEALLVLDAIDNRGSFAAAAEQLNKVPSALSYIVQKLEEQLSVTLFVRQGRRSVLTPAGRHLLDEGRKLLGAVSKLTEQTQTIAHGWEPKLRIAIDSIFDINKLLEPLNKFLAEHPNIEIDLSEEVMNGSWEALAEDRIDLILGAPAPVPNQQGIRAKQIDTMNQVFVVPNKHELVSIYPPISTTDIQKFRTVIVHDSAKNEVPWTSNVIEQSQHFYVCSVEHKIQAIIAGIGVGFLPKERIKEHLVRGDLIEVKVEQNVKTVALYMAWKTVNRGKGLARLTELIAQHLSS